MLRGDQVKDESGLSAVFTETGSSGCLMACATSVDAIARMPGCAGEEADAVSAYTQALIKSTDTWITIQFDRWPKAWKGKYKQPVCKLRLALYGHPQAGHSWEKHCHAKIAAAGFEPVIGWESLWVHRQLKLFLTVYVDDFKLAGIAENLQAGWKLLLDQKLKLDPPTPLGKYLGCGQLDVKTDANLVKSQRENYSGLFTI